MPDDSDLHFLGVPGVPLSVLSSQDMAANRATQDKATSIHEKDTSRALVSSRRRALLRAAQLAPHPSRMMAEVQSVRASPGADLGCLQHEVSSSPELLLPCEAGLALDAYWSSLFPSFPL